MSAARNPHQAGPLQGLKLMTPGELRALDDELGALTDGMPVACPAELMRLAAELRTSKELEALLGGMETLSADLETLPSLDPYKPAAGAGLGEKGGQA